MNASYTTGPWHSAAKSTDDPTCPEYLILQGTGYLATVDSSRNENSANARLIAAAPELLEALIECRALMDGEGGVPVGVRGRADSAIAKARGGDD